MRRFAALLALWCSAAAPLDPAALEALRTIDLRMATIGYRLVTGNAALCDPTTPATGLVLHAIDQFDAATQPAARQVFGFETPVSIEAVVPDSPAARAGLSANDGVVAVDGAASTAPGTTQGSATRDAALALIERSKGSMRLETVRKEQRRTVALASQHACAARFEVLLGPEMTAQADATTVQIGVRFFERYRDAETAAIVAHELAHIVLRHRERLAAARVRKGLLAEVGRSGRLNRRVEDEADRLSVHLLRNAGYDPMSAARFWRTHGGDIDGGLFRSRTHASSGARAKAIEAEIAAIPAEAGVPYIPPLVAAREEGF